MLRKNAMAKSISENNSRDLWKEVYKVRSKCKTSSQCMDDVVVMKVYQNYLHISIMYCITLSVLIPHS